MCSFSDGAVVMLTTLAVDGLNESVDIFLNWSIVLHPWFEWSHLSRCCYCEEVRWSRELIEIRLQLFDSVDNGSVSCLKATESREQIGSDIIRAGDVLDLKIKFLDVPLPLKYFG